MAITIIDPKLSFRSLTKRSKTTHLILHHTASENTSVNDVHSWHLNKGWAGIGYNFYIRKNGAVYKGRGWEYIGAHCEGSNSFSIGLCFEGNYETTSTSMPAAQYNAGVEMIREILNKYPSITKVGGHIDFGPSACPGKHFPKAKMIADGKSSGGSGGTTTPEEPIGSVKYTVTTSSSPLNCRQTPSSSGAIVGQFAKGSLVTATKKSGTWLYITDGKTTGWSSSSYLTNATETAIHTLVSQGIINTPDYWLKNYTTLTYLDLLLINMANAPKRGSVGSITTVDDAIERLAAVGIINTPGYWVENHTKLQYIDELLVRVANRV